MKYEYSHNIRISETITSNAVAKKVANSILKFNTNPTMKLGKRGYYEIYIPLKGWKKFHHYVWEKENKKTLPKGYVIHHIDENKLNNDISNLQLMSVSEHNSHHRRKK